MHDADRLPNGNTLVTLRSLNEVVLELDRDGKVVWELTRPELAERRRPPAQRPHAGRREHSRCASSIRSGNEVWKKDMSWAVEVNRY